MIRKLLFASLTTITVFSCNEKTKHIKKQTVQQHFPLLYRIKKDSATTQKATDGGALITDKQVIDSVTDKAEWKMDTQYYYLRPDSSHQKTVAGKDTIIHFQGYFVVPDSVKITGIGEVYKTDTLKTVQ